MLCLPAKQHSIGGFDYKNSLMELIFGLDHSAFLESCRFHQTS